MSDHSNQPSRLQQHLLEMVSRTTRNYLLLSAGCLLAAVVIVWIPVAIGYPFLAVFSAPMFLLAVPFGVLYLAARDHREQVRQRRWKCETPRFRRPAETTTPKASAGEAGVDAPAPGQQ